jgi:hypothetical protein
MSTPTTHDDDEHDDATNHSTSIWPMLIAAGSALFVGYVCGRTSYYRDIQAALRKIEESPEPIEVTVQTL